MIQLPARPATGEVGDREAVLLEDALGEIAAQANRAIRDVALGLVELAETGAQVSEADVNCAGNRAEDDISHALHHLYFLAEDRLEIGFSCRRGLEPVVLREDLEDTRRDERGEGWPEADILDTEVKEREKNADSLLLVP